mgnify:CR=1 FL=1
MQYVSSDATLLALGGGPAEDDHGDTKSNGAVDDDKDSMFALTLNEDLSRGTSNYSTTFDNPSFGTDFQVANIEVWTLSPVEDLEQAVIIELSRQFVFDHGNFAEQ